MTETLHADARVQPASTVSAATERLSWPLVIGWGIGTIGPVTLLYIINFALLFFMTDRLGVAAGLAGTLIFATRLFDLAFDLAVGAMSDRTESRWGRRRPWMFWGAIVTSAGCIMLFNIPGALIAAGQPPSVTLLVWLAAALSLYFGGYSMYNVPYLAMPAEMTDSYQERTRLMSGRVICVAVSGLLGVTIANWLVGQFGGTLSAYGRMALIMTAVCLVTMMAAVMATRTAKATLRDKVRVPFARQFAIAATNKPFLILIGTKLMILLSLSAITSTIYFFIVQVMHQGPGMLSIYGLVSNAGILVSMPIWVRIGRRLSKQAVFAVAIAVNIPLSLSWLLATPGETVWIFGLRGFLLGFGAGGALLMGQSLLPDTIEYDYRRSGLRREGVFAAVYSFVEKASFAAGPLIVGSLLGIFGYVASKPGEHVVQPPEAVTAIYLGMAIIPAVTSAIGVVMLMFYDLTEAKLQAMSTAAEIHPKTWGAAADPIQYVNR